MAAASLNSLLTFFFFSLFLVPSSMAKDLLFVSIRPSHFKRTDQVNELKKLIQVQVKSNKSLWLDFDSKVKIKSTQVSLKFFTWRFLVSLFFIFSSLTHSVSFERHRLCFCRSQKNSLQSSVTVLHVTFDAFDHLESFRFSKSHSKL